MKNNSLFVLMVILLAGLIGGAAFINGGVPLSLTEQVSNPEASTLASTDQQSQQLAFLVVIVFLSLGGMTTGLAVFFYLFNRGAAKAEAEADQPLDFSLEPQGNSLGALLQNNIVALVLAGATILVGIIISAVILSGSLGL